eukprot:g409.t1
MLGNFSFDAYFKEEAIFYAWTYITQTLCLPKERLRVTVFEKDVESRALWKKIAGLRDDHVVDRGVEDNFWSLGAKDCPCGPSSEIFWDTEGTDVRSVMGYRDDDGDDRWLEIWNLVFMQHVQASSSIRSDDVDALDALAQPAVDTGMGLERIASVVQGVSTNFETDNFQCMLRALDAELDVRSVADGLGRPREDDDSIRAARHVVVDHVRAAAFLIADGVFPSAVGRGYVLRRILRRAVRYGHAHLGAREPLLCALVPAVLETMGDAHAEHLRRHQHTIESILRNEETMFMGTLERGMKLLDRHMRNNSKEVPASLAFRLYDTFGFPVDLTDVIARERGCRVDLAAVDALMLEQRERARLAWAGSGDRRVPQGVLDWKADGVTNAFNGYDVDASTMTPPRQNCEVVAISSIATGSESENKDKATSDFVAIDPCPFFSRGGGQVGDVGEIRLLDGSDRRFRVVGTETAYDDGIVLQLEPGESASALAVGAKVEARIDSEHRSGCAAHHTATHMLHASLRDVLGGAGGAMPVQAGSNVQQNGLTFDFTHNRALTQTELDQIEEQVNRCAESGLEVRSDVVNMRDALESGAMAHFEDRYTGDVARVVSIGDADASTRSLFSAELCCGTHVNNTRLVSPFVILKERSVAAGTRRIEAVAGHAAVRWLMKQQRILRSASSALDVESSQLPARLERMAEQDTAQKDQIKALRTLCAEVPRDSKADAVVKFRGADSGTRSATVVHIHVLSEGYASDPSLMRHRGEALQNLEPDASHVLLSGRHVLCCAPASSNAEGKRKKKKRVKGGNAASGMLGAKEILQPLLGALKGRGGGSMQYAQGTFERPVTAQEVCGVIQAEGEISK